MSVAWLTAPWGGRATTNPTANHLPLHRPGAAMLALFAAAVVFYRIPALAGNRLAAQLFAWLLVGGTLAAYLAGYRLLQSLPDASPQRGAIIVFAVAFALLAILIPPFHSTDLFFYVNVGWQQVGYGLNPYVCTLDDTPGWATDPMFYPEWGNTRPLMYGFLFSAICSDLCWLGGGHCGATLLLFKALNAAAFALTGWLAWLGCRRLRLPVPDRAMYLLLWNPLLLIHVLANGHNDLLMALASAAAVYCALAGGWLAVVPLLAAGALIKYGAAAVMPLALLFVAKRYGIGKAAAGLALGLLLCAVAAAPYLVYDWRQLPLEEAKINATEMCNSLPALVSLPCEVAVQWWPALRPCEGPAAAAVKLAFAAAFLAFYGRLIWRRLHGPYDQAEFLRDGVLVQFVLVCLVSAKFYPWYLGMFLPLAIWLPAGDWLRRAILAIACAQMLALTFVGQSHGLNVVAMLLLPLVWVLFPRAFALASLDSAACSEPLTRTTV